MTTVIYYKHPIHGKLKRIIRTDMSVGMKKRYPNLNLDTVKEERDELIDFLIFKDSNKAHIGGRYLNRPAIRLPFKSKDGKRILKESKRLFQKVMNPTLNNDAKRNGYKNSVGLSDRVRVDDNFASDPSRGDGRTI